MPIFKKLIFAIPLLLSLAIFYIQANSFLQDFSALFSLDLNLIIKLVIFAATIVLVSYLFVIFVNLAVDYKLVVPVILVSVALSFLYSSDQINYYLAGGLLIAFGASYGLVYNKIKKDPTNFQVSGDVNKPSGQLATLIILAVAVALYFSAVKNNEQFIQKFIDSIVGLSSSFTQSQQLTENTSLAQTPNLPISQAEINQLKQNPELLKQFGLDPSILNQLDTKTKTVTPQSIATEALKPVITKQVNDFIRPFVGIIPFLIVFIFYLNFQFAASILLFISSPLTYLLFMILEKVGFIKYEVTTRQVKKLIV